MKRYLFLTGLFVFLLSAISAQNGDDKVLLTIEDKKISANEFIHIYEKNRKNLSTGEITPVDEYLDLFLKFQLKVYEAEQQGLDTSAAFQKELAGYRKQLEKPYLIEQKVIDSLVREAYNRLQTELRVSHILIKIPGEQTPEDTAYAYEKALDIIRRIEQGEKFENVAKGTSDDPTVKRNGGDLGYFTGLKMVYPFENAAYNAEVGEIAGPVRTRFGYHIIKVHDKRKAKGEVKVAHIMLVIPPDASPNLKENKKEQIFDLYHQLKEGADFSKLAKQYSEDRGSARQGGELPWFGSGRMVKEFEDAAFSLKRINAISSPVRTSVGWHILKLLDKKELGSFEDMEAEIRRKVRRDGRASIARERLIQTIKTDKGFTEKTENLILLADGTNPDTDELNDTLFIFNDRLYKLKDFQNYIHEEMNLHQALSYAEVEEMYKKYTESIILTYQREQLPEKYPGFKYTLKEYHDGILLFDITDRTVWTRASKDSIGLKKYFKDHRNEYMWGERYEGTIYYCEGEDVLKKVKKLSKGGLFRKRLSDEELLDEFNKEEEQLRIEKGTFEKGDSPIVDYEIWNGKAPHISESYFIRGKKIAPKLKKLSEVRGKVISDYQEHLEEKWVEELMEKYNYQFIDSTVKAVKDKF